MPRPASAHHWAQLRADIGRLVGRRLPTGADVEDVVQDVLLRVWRHSDTLRDGERFGPWLGRIASTAAADHMRARQRHPLPRFPVAAEAETASSEETTGAVDPEPDAKGRIAAALRPFIAALPAVYHDAVRLSELEGQPHAVIAERLGLSVSGVKSRVQRGRKELKAMLERCCEIALDARGAPVSCEVRPDGVLPPGCCPEPIGPTCERREDPGSADGDVLEVDDAVASAQHHPERLAPR
jgi:RNA polymerase sigma-70 factor (ECF subfamily)